MASISYYFQLFIYIHYINLEIIRRIFKKEWREKERDEIEEGKQFFSLFFLCYVNRMYPFSSFSLHYKYDLSTFNNSRNKKVFASFLYTIFFILILYFLRMFNWIIVIKNRRTKRMKWFKNRSKPKFLFFCLLRKIYIWSYIRSVHFFVTMKAYCKSARSLRRWWW